LVYFATTLAGGKNHDVRRRKPFYISKREGREPAMTRIPLNRAYEQSLDLREKLEMSTAEIGLAVRTTNCLEERGVFTVNDLLHCTREDLLSISNFGEKTLEEVYKALENVGFYRPNREPANV
jgi:DNA-directed RNA polymerase subunit alpha